MSGKENLMCSAHKSANEKSRAGWERTFGRKRKRKILKSIGGG